MLRSIPFRELVRRFHALGFDGPYSGGRHLFMSKGQLKARIPNPHRGDLSRHLIAEILRQANISKDLWNEME